MAMENPSFLDKFSIKPAVIYKGFAIDLGSLEMDSWVFPNIVYMVELNCSIWHYNINKVNTDSI